MTSTLTLLGQSQANESATKMNGSLKMSKSQLDMPIDECDGLRIRDSAKVSAAKDQQVIPDENNNVTKVAKDEDSQVQGETRGAYKMWGFFPVDQPIKTLNSIMIPLVHVACIYSLMNITADTQWRTILWGFFMGGAAGFGVTGGVHRMWTHKSYKAKLPLRIILAVCFSMSGQNTIFDWVRDHRVHHKYSETDADPHDSNRGFWFAHCGWLMMNKHPNVLAKGKAIDMSDILADPVVRFHEKYFIPMKILFCFILPSLVPSLWGETWYNAFVSQAVIRYVLSLNFTWLVNSAAHIWGSRPYDKRINPAENIIVSMFAMGEGWHNYHHVFPWDYKAAELPYKVNFTTILIHLFAKIGWAYDMKEPSKDLVRRIIDRHGDGSYVHNDGDHHHMPEVEYEETVEEQQQDLLH